jgi:NADH dehydrogenase FAD-containing subunit
VTLITKSPTLAPKLESINRFYLMKLLQEFHVAVVTGASVERAIPGGVKAIVRGRKQEFTGFDTVVFVDRLSPDNSLVNSCTDLVKEIRIIGDAHEVRDAGSAVLSGFEAGLKV